MVAMATAAIAILALLLAVWPQTAQAQAGCSSAAAQFAFTGDVQCYDIPFGTRALRVTAVGAPGANGGSDGAGARVEATVEVEGGTRIFVYVGGPGSLAQGGFNGGGSATNGGGGGGGATDIRTCLGDDPACLAERLIVAAGGGGAGGGGSGGSAGLSAGDGQDGVPFSPTAGAGEGGDGATIDAGGAGGAGGAGDLPPGGPGGTGALGIGGGGGSGSSGGGGGGGGLYGGGGGGGGGRNSMGQAGTGGGGGAGSRFEIPAAIDASITTDETRTPMLQITPIFAPFADTAPASDLGATHATLNGVVNPFLSETQAYFQYATDAQFEPSAANPYAAGATTPAEDIGADLEGRLVQADVGGLLPETVYHFRIVAEGDFTAEGEDETFTTLSPDDPSQVADLAVDLEMKPDRPRVGRRLSYTVRIAGTGPATAEGVSAIIDLPKAAELLASPAGCAITGPRMLNCEIQDLPVGELSELKLRLRPKHANTARFAVEVLSETTDPDPLNNSASVAKRVRR